MARFRRNPIREERIQRLGQTADLPLFGRREAVPLSEMIPRTMELATDTKRLSHIAKTHNSFTLGEDQQKVFDLLCERGPLTNKEMAEILGWDPGTVSARNYEIRAFGLVVPDVKRPCSITGVVVQAWRVK